MDSPSPALATPAIPLHPRPTPAPALVDGAHDIAPTPTGGDGEGGGGGGDIATIGNVRPSGTYRWFQLTDLLERVVEQFNARPDCFGVLVADGPRFVAAFSREALAERLARPYVRELFLDKPISTLLENWPSTPTEMPAATPINAALASALQRPVELRYEPLVVVAADGTRKLLDVHALLMAQCDVLGRTLDALEQQRRATQAAEAEREALHARLVTASREAGRAEVATGVLHNVGNVLNSLNASAAAINRTLQQSKVSSLTKAAELIREHEADPASFLTADEKGKRLPGYLVKLASLLAEEQNLMVEEMAALGRSLEHIRQVVQMQQSYAKVSAVRELVRPAQLFEDALRVNMVSFDRHHVHVVRELGEIEPLAIDKHKVLQILINLVSNAKNATKSMQLNDRRIVVRTELLGGGGGGGGGRRVRFVVTDNGIGIKPDDLTRIFSHGFTTRKDGHGFGLHSAANAARELGGTLTAASDGPGRGATFALELPTDRQASTTETT